MLPGRFPADNLFSPIVFGVAIRHAVLVRNIKDGELTSLIIHGRDPLRLAVHDRMLALDHRTDLAQRGNSVRGSSVGAG